MMKVCATFFDAERIYTYQLGASADTAPAENTAVMLEDKIRVRCIHWVRLPVWLKRPVGHAFTVGGILQLAVSVGYLAVRAEVIALAEYQREYKLPRILHLRGVGAHDHVV